MTDKAIEALKVLSENVRHKAGIEFGGLRDNEATRSAIVTLMEFARAALEAKAEPVAVFRCQYDETGCIENHWIEWLVDASKLSDMDVLYSAPPTTAEVKAQALEDRIFVGFTNGAQILYANDSCVGEGAFYSDTDNDCYIPLYMLKRHVYRLQSTSFGEVTLDRIKSLQSEVKRLREEG